MIMKETGIRNATAAIATTGLKDLAAVYFNFGPAQLYEESIRRGESVVFPAALP